MKKGILIQFCVALFCAILVSFSLFAKSSDDVKIGKQIWMTKNLNVDKFRNGDIIPEVKTMKEWLQAFIDRKPAWCYYKNDKANGKIYGKLYNGFAVVDPRGLAPAGWHIPSKSEWDDLVILIGGRKIESTAGSGKWIFSTLTDGVKLKGKETWNDSYFPGTNETGFNWLAGGQISMGGVFNYQNNSGYLWSSTSSGNLTLWYADMGYANPSFFGAAKSANQGNGFSVRCIKD